MGMHQKAGAKGYTAMRYCLKKSLVSLEKSFQPRGIMEAGKARLGNTDGQRVKCTKWQYQGVNGGGLSVPVRLKGMSSKTTKLPW